jgi:predicted nucleic acid-binding protein
MSDEPAALHFVDTKILIYAHDISAGKKQILAANLLEQLWVSRQGCLSIQVLQEFYVNATRKIARPLERETAAQIVAELSFWKVHTPQTADILAALDLERRLSLSFWDAMIIQSALQMNCPVLYSEDFGQVQRYAAVRVINPFA